MTVPVTCDAIKVSYRQSKDGFVVAFAIHPQDIPAELANAAIGSMWQLSLVELDDDGNPDTRVALSTTRGQRAGSEKASSGPARSWKEMSAPERAGILCSDVVFQKWIGAGSEDEAAETIRNKCNVSSRSYLTAGNVQWQAIQRDYRVWRLEPKVGL